MTYCLPEPALWPAADGRRLSAEVESHLQSCARCSARVSELRDHRQPVSMEDCTGTSSHRRMADADGVCPVSIGSYPVERLLRLGGQAEVYLARHPELERDVVVKWAYATITDEPRVADQFTGEARLLSSLKHPHLPALYDLGIAADRPFIALEYIAGESLAQSRRRFHLPRTAALMIARVARVLHAVHDFGMLHLDIQPGNILLGSDGEPRLIDFGLSLPQTAGPELRHAAALHGTPEYMAPEQLAGDAERIGVATDIYGLGAVLYELLCGAPPQPEIIWTSREAGRSASHGAPAIPRRLQ